MTNTTTITANITWHADDTDPAPMATRALVYSSHHDNPLFAYRRAHGWTGADGETIDGVTHWTSIPTRPRPESLPLPTATAVTYDDVPRSLFLYGHLGAHGPSASYLKVSPAYHALGLGSESAKEWNLTYYTNRGHGALIPWISLLDTIHSEVHAYVSKRKP